MPTKMVGMPAGECALAQLPSLFKAWPHCQPWPSGSYPDLHTTQPVKPHMTGTLFPDDMRLNSSSAKNMLPQHRGMLRAPMPLVRQQESTSMPPTTNAAAMAPSSRKRYCHPATPNRPSSASRAAAMGAPITCHQTHAVREAMRALSVRHSQIPRVLAGLGAAIRHGCHVLKASWRIAAYL